MGLNPTGIQFNSGVEKSPVPSGVMFRSQPWHIAYMAALFESDRSKISDRIKEAEQLILKRVRELFTGSADPTEQRHLGRALHALHALRACLNL